MDLRAMYDILLIISVLGGIISEGLSSDFPDSCKLLVGISKGNYCPITENINTNIPLPKNCKEAFENGYKNSGLYKILPCGHKKPVRVLCDMEIEGGGWTHIQKRFDGSEDFNRSYREYKFGFGNLKGEFWLGLENIYQLTGTETNELLIEITDHNLVNYYARYSVFRIGSEYDGYALKHAAGYWGNTTGDCMKWHEGQTFSTFDLDRDTWSEGSCANLARGGWWYKKCYCVTLNGQLRNLPNPDRKLRGMNWNRLEGNELKSEATTLLYGSRMLIRPKS
ncbi:microfibril-associated glycoprotein 4-like [Diabrotica undecimpunctata]|uniref:microfibril-associated glycoprotein 4-like n=1 Tax=Diabrotica undecimpunctata TaxID=50387 RepID=UPI003B64060A